MANVEVEPSPAPEPFASREPTAESNLVEQRSIA